MLVNQLVIVAPLHAHFSLAVAVTPFSSRRLHAGSLQFVSLFRVISADCAGLELGKGALHAKHQTSKKTKNERMLCTFNAIVSRPLFFVVRVSELLLFALLWVLFLSSAYGRRTSLGHLRWEIFYG